MGKDGTDSVCDGWGRVHGHEDLFIADGSLFPQSSHVNPYLTIMALADRVSERVLKDLGHSGDLGEARFAARGSRYGSSE
jgi:choline dehydrogenase-like flavoprotein